MRLLAAFLALVVALNAAGLPERPIFAQESSDLKPDPAARFGTLPNGLRYVILPNKEPHERVSLRLLVLGGSLHETDSQQGLAHFLEHMAFNGSDHYPPGTLIEFFQRMGMSFGGDTNAHTSFDHTAYLLELPKSDTKTTAEGLRVLADYAGHLLLQDNEIDRERGIVLSEKRDRDSVSLREWVAETRFTLSESLLPKRLPIGTAEVISQSKRDLFRAYYDAWYRPERLAVVAVGDFDPKAIEEQLTATLGPIQGRGPNVPNPDLGKVPEFTGIRTHAHHEAESGATRVSIQSVVPFSGEDDTAAVRTRDTLRDLGILMLNRRLEILARKDDAPFTQGSASATTGFDQFRNAGVELSCKADQWSAALAVAEKERRRALQHGFTSAELAEASANVLNHLEQDARTATTRRSNDLADAVMDALLEGHVFTTPAADLALLGPVVRSATAESVTAAFRKEFDQPGLYVTVIGNAKVADSPSAAAEAIAKAYRQSAAEKVDALSDQKVAEFGYTDFGQPGQIKATRHVEDLDLDQSEFANGVRFNFKKTDFEANTVRVLLRVGGGLLTQPTSQPGLNFLADNTVISGGLGRHSFDDLRRILAGKTVTTQFRTAGDAFILSGQTNRQDFRTQLQVLSAYLVDPGLRPEALLQARKQFEQLYTQLTHVPEGPLQTQALRLLANGDPRFGFPAPEELAGRTLEEVRQWIAPQFAQGPLEVTVIGDVDATEAREAVAATLGALPKRATKPNYEKERSVTFPAPVTRVFNFQSELPKSYVYIAWPTTDNRDITTTRQLHLLSEIFSDRLRLKIREELGDAYSPFSVSSPSDSFWNYGTFAAIIGASPDKVEALTQATLEIAQALARDGVTADEVERAKQPVLTAIREASRTNQYWAQNVLGASQEYPNRLDWRRTIESGHAAIDEAQVDALARKYLSPDRAFRFSSVPKKEIPAAPVPGPRP